MTQAQLEQCKACTNRKKGTIEGEILCTIPDFTPKDDAACIHFEQDKLRLPSLSYPTAALKPNAHRANYAMIGVVVVLFLDAVSAVADYSQYNVLIDVRDGIFVSDDKLQNNDLVQQGIAIVYLIAFITSAVFFILWFRRAYYNLGVRTETTYYSEGWAAGSWFVPIISLFRPFQIMKELDEDTSELLGKASSTEVNTNSFLIGTWWTLWIISNYIGNVVIKSMFQAETIENYINLTLLDMISSCFGIPLALVTVYMIKNYANKETALVAEENKILQPPTRKAF